MDTTKSLKITKPKTKIRRLAGPEEVSKKQKGSNCLSLLFLTPILILIISYSLMKYFPDLEIQKVLTNLHDNYEKQYNSIVQGNPEYCNQELNVQQMFSKIREEVLNQDEALAKLQSLLSNSSNFRGLIIAGSPGVGKTLFANSLKENFYWKSNTQKYIWNTFNENDIEGENHSELEAMLNNLSGCGENLIFIDNLHPKDLKDVLDFHIKAHDKVKVYENEDRLVKLTIIFLVTIPNYTEIQKTEYNKHLETLSQVTNLNPTFFKSFEKPEILDCIRQIITKENIVLDENIVNEILNSIDIESGCKKVRVKTAVYRKL